MRLDPTTLTVVLGMQLVLMALALPIITGWRSSAGVRLGMACIWSQLIGVVLLGTARVFAYGLRTVCRRAEAPCACKHTALPPRPDSNRTAAGRWS